MDGGFTLKKAAPLLIIVAGCLWGTMGAFVRHLNTMGLQSMEIVEIRGIIAVLILSLNCKLSTSYS